VLCELKIDWPDFHAYEDRVTEVRYIDARLFSGKEMYVKRVRIANFDIYI